MGEPCQQAEKIGRFEATLQFFQEAEKRREAREVRAEEMLETREAKVAAVLDTIALQGATNGATLIAHGESLARHEAAFSEAFLRLRKVEGSSLIAKVFSGKRGPYIFAAMIALSVYGVLRMDAGTLDKLERILKIFTGGSL